MRLFRRALSAGIAFGVMGLAPPAHAATTVHHWAMDEPPGWGTMVDASTSPSDGKWSHITAGVPGFGLTAYDFNGTSSKVVVADDSSLDPGTSAFTYTVHVNFTRVPDSGVGDYDLIRKGLSGTSGGYWKAEIYPNSSHTKALALCQMAGSTGAAKLVKPGPAKLNDGLWHTITCAKDLDRSNPGLTMTVDGVSYFQAAKIGSISNSAPLSVGAKASGGDWYDGVMDEATLEIGQ